MINHWLLRILSITWYFLSIKQRLCSIVWKRNSQAVACLFDTDFVLLNWFPCLVRTKWVRSLGADILGCCEYKPSNSGTDQTASPRPSPRGGLGSLQNEPWCDSKRTLVRFAWDVKANAPRSDQVLKIIRLFGRNRHPLSRAHYGNHCLISGNSKISRTLSGENKSWLNMEQRGDGMYFG